jgi:putative transcriptional regulator
MNTITGKEERMKPRRKGEIVNRISEMAGIRRMKISDIAREAKISNHAARRLWYGEAKRLDLETLHGLCEAMECQPGDLFEYRNGQ